MTGQGREVAGTPKRSPLTSSHEPLSVPAWWLACVLLLPLQVTDGGLAWGQTLPEVMVKVRAGSPAEPAV